MLTSSRLVRQIRTDARTSQRELAALAGTSGPTIAAYEAGTKEARLSTVERLADVVGQRVTIVLEPSDEGGRARQRRAIRSRALAAATAEAVRLDWSRARELAQENLDRMAAVVGDNRAALLLDRWRELVRVGASATSAALRDTSEDGDELRQMQPFAGILDEHERRIVLAAADAWSAGL